MKLNFTYTTNIIKYLMQIEKYKTALEYLMLPTRTKQKLMYEAKLKRTHFSTSIEGNVLSYNQVEKVVQNKSDSKRLSAEQEVQNYWDALTFLEESSKLKRKIDLDFIFDLHNIIEKKSKIKHIGFREPTPPGVIFAVYDSITRKPEYIPPQASEVKELVEELVEWYYANYNLPTPIKAAIIHYAFVTIHPFSDGNGRTARALSTYVLMLEEYDFKGCNSLEEFYMSDLNGYYSTLQMDLPVLYYEGREEPPHLEIWIEYFCKIMALNSERIYEQAKEASRKEENEFLTNLSKKDITLIRYCLENKIEKIKTKELSTLFGVTTRAISKWAVEWVEKGILEPTTGTERITSYKLSNKYKSLKISSIGFVE